MSALSWQAREQERKGVGEMSEATNTATVPNMQLNGYNPVKFGEISNQELHLIASIAEANAISSLNAIDGPLHTAVVEAIAAKAQAWATLALSLRTRLHTAAVEERL